MQTILITGGAGFIGSQLAEALLKRGYTVIILDNFSTGKRANIPPAAIAVEGDICEPLGEVFSNYEIEGIFHLAAIGRVRQSFMDPEGTARVNVRGTLNLLEAARKYGVERLVFASSASVYGEQTTYPVRESAEPNPISPYGWQKWEAERAVRSASLSSGLKTVALRYFNVFGPRQDSKGEHAAFIPKTIASLIHKGQGVVYGTGEQKRDFTFIDTIVQANLKALVCTDPRCFGGVFNVGAGMARSVNVVAQHLSQMVGGEVFWEIQETQKEPLRSEADVALLREVLGVEDGISFEEGLKRTWAWYWDKHRTLVSK